MSPGLHRRYGYFRCSQCGKSWESSHVYVNSAGVAQYGQECKDCRVMCKPYRLERLVCSLCGLQSCNCDRRHIDASKSHRSDLCGKCRAGLPCYAANRF